MALVRFIPAGDIDIVDGKVVLLTGKGYVRQKIASRLKFFLGEWMLDQREGVPYYRDVLVKNPDMELVRSVFRRVITSVDEVASVPQLALNLDKKTRKLGVEFDAQLVGGDVLSVRQPDAPFILSLPN